MVEKIIYINNVSSLPNIEKKQWDVKNYNKLEFITNLSRNDFIYFVIIKSNKKEVYFTTIDIIVRNNIKNKVKIIFKNIIKIDCSLDFKTKLINLNKINKLII